MRIAVVDDIASERKLLCRRLTEQFARRGVHADLFEYENGESFLAGAKERPFTVVFLDIYMTGANGIETAKSFEASIPTASLSLPPPLLIMRWKVSGSEPCITS